MPNSACISECCVSAAGLGLACMMCFILYWWGNDYYHLATITTNVRTTPPNATTTTNSQNLDYRKSVSRRSTGVPMLSSILGGEGWATRKHLCSSGCNDLISASATPRTHGQRLLLQSTWRPPITNSYNFSLPPLQLALQTLQARSGSL